MGAAEPLLRIARDAPGAFASDLHLSGDRPAMAAAFTAFLSSLRPDDRLYLLGDVFDYWIGDDDLDDAFNQRMVQTMALATARGVQLQLMHGNRDFLLEATFEQRTGARVHPAGFVGRCAGVRTLLVHGDELCTLDHGYQRLKSVLRSGPVRWLAPRLPRPLSLAAARRLRSASVRAVAEKPPESKRQQRAEASALGEAARARHLVVGHAHEFRDEDDGALRWLVLDAFGGPRDLVRFGPDGAPEGGSSARA